MTTVQANRFFAGLTLFTHTWMVMCVWSQESPRVICLQSGVVNDAIVDAVCPLGLVQAPNGDLLTIFHDKGDGASGAKSYVVRSSDSGVTWSSPFLTLLPQLSTDGVMAALGSLPGGGVLLIHQENRHVDTSLKSVFNKRVSRVHLCVSSDSGQTFGENIALDVTPDALTSAMGACVELSNGDVILPAYSYLHRKDDAPAVDPPEGYQVGSGFFRSSDGGRSWGRMEIAFQDPPSGRHEKLSFNESSFFVKDNGTIVGFARIDTMPVNNMWRVESCDQGRTWTAPVETSIAGIYPNIIRLRDGRYFMTCGLRTASPTRKVTFFISDLAGNNFQLSGYAPYSKTGGCQNSATGGSQGAVQLQSGDVYVVYYASDRLLPGVIQTYIEGCTLRLEEHRETSPEQTVSDGMQTKGRDDSK